MVSVFKEVPVSVRAKLLQTYCTSWYNSQTWQLGTKATGAMNIQWKKAVRRVMGLPARTRSILLPGLAGNANFEMQHERRAAKHITQMLNSDNTMVSFLAQKAITGVCGITGKNYVYLRNKYGVPNSENKFAIIEKNVNEEIKTRVTCIQDLLYARDELYDINLNKNEISQAIAYYCTY